MDVDVDVVFNPALSDDVDVNVAAVPPPPLVVVVVVVTMMSPDVAASLCELLLPPFVYLAVDVDRFVALVEFSDDEEGLNVRIPAGLVVLDCCCCCCWRSGFS